MLSKKNRLNTKEFEDIFQKGRFVSNDIFICKFVNSEHRAFVVAVPKKVVKGAVARHFIKRRIFNILREKIDQTPVDKKIVLILRKNPSDLKIEELQKTIFDILGKVV